MLEQSNLLRYILQGRLPVIANQQHVAIENGFRELDSFLVNQAGLKHINQNT